MVSAPRPNPLHKWQARRVRNSKTKFEKSIRDALRRLFVKRL